MSNLPEPPAAHHFFPRFLTHVPGRTVRRGFPGFKTHTGLNHAKNAIAAAISQYSYRAGSAHTMRIWEYDIPTASWVLLYTIEPGTLARDLPWRKSD